MEFTRKVEWTPAYTIEEGKNHGRGSMTLRFVLVGGEGAVQFVLYTGFDHSEDRFANERLGGVMCSDGQRRELTHRLSVLPADLGYHSLVPHYEGQSAMGEPCPYLDGRTCYYDGSGLNAMDAFDVFTDRGEEALWAFLEQYYACVFEGADSPPELGRRFKRDMDWGKTKT